MGQASRFGKTALTEADYSILTPFNRNRSEYINVNVMIDCVHRSTLNIINLNTTHKIKDRFRLYHIVKDELAGDNYDQMETSH